MAEQLTPRVANEITFWNATIAPLETNTKKIKSRERWIDVRNYTESCNHRNDSLGVVMTYELWLVERAKAPVHLGSISQKTGIVTITSHFGERKFQVDHDNLHNLGGKRTFLIKSLIGFYYQSLQTSGAAGSQ